MKKIFLNLLALLLCCSTLKAQSVLGVDSGSYTIPNTVSYNSTYTFVVHVKNYGPQPLSGQVDMVYGIDSTGTGTFNSLDTMNAHIVNNMTIAVGAEIPDSMQITINAAFRSGINTVVIWPRSTSAAFFTTHDSLKVNIIVTGLLAGIENYTQSKPIIFPNPMQGRLFIANKDPNFIIEQVRIFDISGQLVHAEKFMGSLDVSKLTSGVYILEVADKNGKLCRYRVVKE